MLRLLRLPVGAASHTIATASLSRRGLRPAHRLLIGLVTVAALLVGVVPSASAGTAPLVISQVYGGAGSMGAVLANDFVELHNRTEGAVSLSGFSVQYASATGSTWQVIPLSAVAVPAGGYYLIQLAAGPAGSPLPLPDQTSSVAI